MFLCKEQLPDGYKADGMICIKGPYKQKTHDTGYKGIIRSRPSGTGGYISYLQAKYQHDGIKYHSTWRIDKKNIDGIFYDNSQYQLNKAIKWMDDIKQNIKLIPIHMW